LACWDCAAWQGASSLHSLVGSLGTISSIDVPRLPPLIHHEHPRNTLESDEEEEEEEDEDEGVGFAEQRRPRRHSSGAKVQDPYAATDSFELVLPIATAVAAFVPVLYCLCKI